MAVIFWVLLAVTVDLGVWFFAHRPKPGTVSPVEEVSLEPSKTLVPATRDVVKNPAPASMPAPGFRPKPISTIFVPAKPDGNVIEYKMVDGYAIAYGDVLLGKPVGQAPDRGYFEAPTPGAWDHPEIPYAIAPDVVNPSRVEKALDYFKQHTPLSFVPYTGQTDAIVFETGTQHCYSSLGRVGGLQPIRIAPGCQPQEIMHEVMHALGFIHEQSRPDRDDYVDILWSNIEEEFRPQFNVVPDSFASAVRGTRFDYHSVMLYRTDAFASQAGQPTMRSKTGESIAPQAQGLSEGDLARISRMFGAGG